MNRQNLPQVVQSYFSPDKSARELFVEDAVVRDKGEDKELRGIEAIEQWMAGNSRAYNLTTELTSATPTDSGHVVRAVVSGTFPGSPYEFEYRFTVSADKVTELVIDPIGSLAK